jgi:ubiquinone/menaquinone biosynthesis C-methylase UbiE
MRIRDPEGVELKHVLSHTDFYGKEVLEIGCGDGRLTFKYAPLAKRVIAIDPSFDDIKKAADQILPELTSKLEFRQGRGEQLPFTDESFDVVFFTYSLCCFEGLDNMLMGVDEAWRVLSSNGGILINLQPSLLQPFKANRGVILHLITRKPRDLVNYDGGDWGDKKSLSRYTIKNATLNDRKFELMVDDTFTRNTYYGSIEDILDEADLELEGPIETTLDTQTYNKVQEMSESLRTAQGILLQRNVILTILRKSSIN